MNDQKELDVIKPFHFTVKIMVWAKSDEEARKLVAEMMTGDELMTKDWFIL